jgi:hypothetical protein
LRAGIDAEHAHAAFKPHLRIRHWRV